MKKNLLLFLSLFLCLIAGARPQGQVFTFQTTEGECISVEIPKEFQELTAYDIVRPKYTDHFAERFIPTRGFRSKDREIFFTLHATPPYEDYAFEVEISASAIGHEYKEQQINSLSFICRWCRMWSVRQIHSFTYTGSFYLKRANFTVEVCSPDPPKMKKKAEKLFYRVLKSIRVSTAPCDSLPQS